MRRVYDENICMALYQKLGSFELALSGPYSGADAQLAVRIYRISLCIPVYDAIGIHIEEQAADRSVGIYERQAHLLAPLHDLVGSFQFRPCRSGDDVFGHGLIGPDLLIAVAEQEVLAGEQSDELSFTVDDGEAVEIVLFRFPPGLDLRDRLVAEDGLGFGDVSAPMELDPGDLLRLLLGSLIAGQDAEASTFGHGDRHVALRHGVHGGAHDGNTEIDPSRESRLEASIRGLDLRISRKHLDIVI
jgi:hypothetical protein